MMTEAFRAYKSDWDDVAQIRIRSCIAVITQLPRKSPPIFSVRLSYVREDGKILGFIPAKHLDDALDALEGAANWIDQRAPTSPAPAGDPA